MEKTIHLYNPQTGVVYCPERPLNITEAVMSPEGADCYECLNTLFNRVKARLNQICSD